MSQRSIVTAAHLAPSFLDPAKTTAKAVDAIAEAARGGAALIAFPESFLPGFPVWSALSAPIFNHDLFTAFVGASVYVDGPEVLALRTAARAHGITVSIGISERSRASVGALWNTNLIIDDGGRIISHHRKIVPTFYEKLIWAPGDGEGLEVHDTSVGRLGALICGENTNPLARYTLMAQAEEVHISTYPPLWPTRDPRGEGKAYDLGAAIRVRAGAHSFEAKVFNIVVSSVLDDSARSRLAGLDADALRILEETPRGVSLVLDPYAEIISETLSADEGLLFQEVDTAACIEPKQFHDVSGYYNRFDIFDLRVNRRRVHPITFSTPEGNPPADREISETSPVGFATL